jgi:hypothetical protein
MTQKAAEELTASQESTGGDCYASLEAPPVTRCFETVTGNSGQGASRARADRKRARHDRLGQRQRHVVLSAERAEGRTTVYLTFGSIYA